MQILIKVCDAVYITNNFVNCIDIILYQRYLYTRQIHILQIFKKLCDDRLQKFTSFKRCVVSFAFTRCLESQGSRPKFRVEGPKGPKAQGARPKAGSMAGPHGAPETSSIYIFIIRIE